MADVLAKRCWMLALFLVAFSATTHAIYVHTATDEILYFNTPAVRFGTRVFNITGARLINADPFVTFCTENEQDFTDRIVLMGKDGCSPTVKIQVAKRKGALAIIIADFSRTTEAGNLYWRTMDGRWPDEDQIIPVATINQADGLALYDLIKNDTDDLLLADLNSDEYNVWKDLLESPGHVTLCALIAAAAVAGLGFALSRFISLLMVQGCTLTTGHFALSFICGGFATMAILYIVHIVDLKVGPVAPEPWYTAFLTFPELFTLLSCLIVSLYWFELINSVSNRPILFLDKLFKPFIGISVAVVVVWLFINFAAGFFLGDTPFLIFALIYFVISLMVVIIWLIVGIKLLKTVRANQKMTITAKKRRGFNRLAVCIILCAAFFLNTRLLYILLTVLPSLSSPENWIVIAGAIFFSQLATLFIQTGLFKLQKRDFKTSGVSDSRGELSPTTSKGGKNSAVELSARNVDRANTARQVDSPPTSPNAGSVGKSSSAPSEISPKQGGAELNGNSAVEKSQVAQLPEVKAGVETDHSDETSQSENKAQNEANQSASSSVSSASSSSASESSSSSEEDSGSGNESYDKTDSSS